MKEIPLSSGKVMLVSDGDFERVNAFKWYASKRGKSSYAIRSAGRRGKCETIYAHRFILEVGSGALVDHKDGNGLNNQRENLRKCSPSQNAINYRGRRLSTSGFRGVYYRSHVRKYRAEIAFDSRRLRLGDFAIPEDAARAYDAAALKYHGEFASLNCPQEAAPHADAA